MKRFRGTPLLVARRHSGLTRVEPLAAALEEEHLLRVGVGRRRRPALDRVPAAAARAPDLVARTERVGHGDETILIDDSAGHGLARRSQERANA